MSPLYILEKIEDEDAGRLGFAAGLPAFGLEESSFFSRSGIPDARSPSAETARGDDAVGDTGAWVLNHSGTPHQRPHLRPL